MLMEQSGTFVSLQLHPDFQNWDDTSFLDFMGEIAPWVRVWTTVASMASNMGGILLSPFGLLRSLFRCVLCGRIVECWTFCSLTGSVGTRWW